MLKCIQTGLQQQRLVMGLQPYSHASASSSRTNDENSGTRVISYFFAHFSTLEMLRKILAATDGTVPTKRKIRQESASIHFGSSLSDWLDLSGRTQISVIFRHRLNRDREWQTYYRRLTKGRLPVLPRSSGFFYYRQPPGAPLLSGKSPLSPHFQ